VQTIFARRVGADSGEEVPEEFSVMV